MHRATCTTAQSNNTRDCANTTCLTSSHLCCRSKEQAQVQNVSIGMHHREVTTGLHTVYTTTTQYHAPAQYNTINHPNTIHKPNIYR